MNSTLPEFSVGCAAPAVASPASLAQLIPGVGTSAASTSGVLPEFAALLPAVPAPPSDPISFSAAPRPEGLLNFAVPPGRLMSAPVKPVPTSVTLGRPASQALERSARLAAASAAITPVVTLMTVAGTAGSPAISMAEEISVTAPVTEPAPARRWREIPRETLEQAAAMATSLLQTLFPEVQLPPLAPIAGSLDLRPQADAAEQASVLPDDDRARAQFFVAADGVVELKLRLPSSGPVEFSAEPSPAAPFQIRAELQLPGEATLRLDATGFTPGPDNTRRVTLAGQENIAGQIPAGKFKLEVPEMAPEIKFVFTGDKQVKAQLPDAGITVAKMGSTMPVAPTEELRATRKPEQVAGLTMRADFPGSPPPAERITEQVAAPAEQNFAERAVETVTNLVEAQFSANMQKSGSVQLRFQFGGEDLRIRVELRDGAVHTDFHTDSPELRTALTREWQTVTAHAAERTLRYLDPVFSTSPAPTSTNADAQQHSARHHQSQQDLSQRSHREAQGDSSSPFSRRSQLNDTFIPEPAATRGPVLLPTSSRLSVLA